MKLITWLGFGCPDVYHLVEAHEGTQRRAPIVPLCGGERVTAVVHRPDGLYCRWCVGLEGVTQGKSSVSA